MIEKFTFRKTQPLNGSFSFQELNKKLIKVYQVQ